jgi:hypothetical protein
VATSEGMRALGDKVRHAVKHTWANGNQREKENQEILVHTLAISLSRQKNEGRDKDLVISSVFVLGVVPELLSGGCSILQQNQFKSKSKVPVI